MAKIPPGVGPRFAQVVVLFGATGDLARRKLLPGLHHRKPAPISQEKNKVFRGLLPVQPHDVMRGQYTGLACSRPVRASVPKAPTFSPSTWRTRRR